MNNKELLFKDISSRLFYGLNVKVYNEEFENYNYPFLITAISKFGEECRCKVYNPIYTPFGCPKIEEIKPYLRPISSMTEEEKTEYFNMHVTGTDSWWIVNWLNERHLDYHYLIDKRLALEAPEHMY